MEIVADLHLHSRFSIATSRDADLEHLDLWGRLKGVSVVGTGDCTHPGWLGELEQKLVPADAGTYALKSDLTLPLPVSGKKWDAAPPVRFLITGEVSTIFSLGGRVRKVHLVLILSGLEAARTLSQRLGRLGNVTADGRPILGLSARQLLELALAADPQALVIPAHIWTPWFSVLGAKSGFDSLEECFGDLVRHIYALETGLSSDPPMNWRVAGLDRYLLVSNSDAHSPAKLGREANLFHVDPTFPALSQALRTGEGFGGTLEFFPQEGKYHLDGHRKCGVRLTPEESRDAGGRCSHCGKPLTLGVMHRVMDLADREPGVPAPAARPFASLIALPEILGEVLGVKSGSKKVDQLYLRLLERLGPELTLLRHSPLEELAREGGPLVAHAMGKMRRGEVQIAGGYDGAYGEIHLLTAEERQRLQGQGAFFSLAQPASDKSEVIVPPIMPVGSEEGDNPSPVPTPVPDDDPLLDGLNAGQRAAVLHQGSPLLVQAGPGTGKTRALTHRLAFLLARRGARPESVLAVTFTRQAAGEMAARVVQLLPGFSGLAQVNIKTFHALGQQLLLEAGEARGVAGEEERRAMLKEAASRQGVPLALLDRQVALWKQAGLHPGEVPAGAPPASAAAFAAYEAALAGAGLWDYEDLISRPVRLLTNHLDLRDACRRRFRHLLVDEYQDLNEAQYRFFRALAGPETDVMAIGDPDQAIYGFRGARAEYFYQFEADWPGVRHLAFNETYRLPVPVLAASRAVLSQAGVAPGPLVTHATGEEPVALLEGASEQAEARAVARHLERLVGGLSHQALSDEAMREQALADPVGFKDIAVLYRFHALSPALQQAFTEAGIPWEEAREDVGPDWEGLDLKAEKVKLLSLHAAKGLEFPYVFIVGCEAGLIPWEPEGSRQVDLGEECRLFYVGLTRARRQVFLTRARARTLWGKRRSTTLSPLAAALNPQKLRDKDGRKRPCSAGRQGNLFY